MKPPFVARPGRRSYAMLLGLALAVVLAACGDGLSLVAVNPGDTPLPFKTPRVDGDDPAAGSASTGATTPEFETDTQPAVEVAAADAPVPADPGIVETEATTPAPAADEPPVDTDLPDAADAEAWLITMIENPAARNIAIRAHEVGANLLVGSETVDPTAYFDADILNLAFASNARSFYGVLAFTALPPPSEFQILSPLLFFEQIVVHDSAEETIQFSEAYQTAVIDFFIGQGAQLMNAALPDVFQPGGASQVTPFSAPQFADDVIFLEIEWPVNVGAQIAPRLHIALIRQGNVTAAVALGSSDESQRYRFADVVERLNARMR